MRYTFTAPEQPVLLWFDPKQLQKVFYNLLSNAFRFTHPNGTIEIIIEEFEKEVVVKIIDNGTGICQEDIERIFDRFYQAYHPGTSAFATQGTGIGLSLCKNIVELHRGTIDVKSTPGYGSIFMVHIRKGNEHFEEKELGEEMPQVVLTESFSLSSTAFNEPEEIMN
ncbi:MAG: HAMP domain-containing histidine kinase [Tannerellaceae bacterium]|nr:HAMP domain-containing histidine kinase [Tannerellaceae bacterium]